MPINLETSSRRDFVAGLGSIAVVAPLGLHLPHVGAPQADRSARPALTGDWDLSWTRRLEAATDRAVFDWPTMGDPADSIVLQLAQRYLDNCNAVYGSGSRAGVVLNIRTTATSAALTDASWDQFSLGAEYKVVDPETTQPARRNPFLRRATGAPAGTPDLAELMQRGAILLACDFALGHLAKRFATRLGRETDAVHGELRAGLLPGCFLVPSGIFGLARAQNAGCALVRV